MLQKFFHPCSVQGETILALKKVGVKQNAAPRAVIYPIVIIRQVKHIIVTKIDKVKIFCSLTATHPFSIHFLPFRSILTNNNFRLHHI